ncbi:MAG: TMEM165/GDT1 family protein [Candidatus Omnitrophica bacterium]|nr:TMEM165/GDT1 family protein [Candidatus Omnitrophota bacterium]
MLQAILSSFIVVAVCEMGDKTQLLSLVLAARFKKPWPIMAGIFVATIFNHALASYAGQWVSQVVRPDVMAYILAASFIAFGFWALHSDSLDMKEKKPRFGAFLTTTILFFLVEMGDKTQLATVALGARYQSGWTVTIGTTFGMLASNGLAVFLGHKLLDKVPMKWVHWFAAGLFFLFGLYSLLPVIYLGR